MPTTPGDAPLGASHEHRIPSLAKLYDEFAHSLEPFSEDRDEAERIFITEISAWYDLLSEPKPPFRDFRRGVIQQCKKYLAANAKPQDKGLLRGLDEDRPA
jgi:hypothetical protein